MPPRVLTHPAILAVRSCNVLFHAHDALNRCLFRPPGFIIPTSFHRVRSTESKASKSNRSTNKGPVKRTLRLPKKTRVRDARPPAPGERKAIRKRIVLSNTNAFEVPGLQEFTLKNAMQYDSLTGRVLALPAHLVDSLRAVEGFKVGQGWGFFQRPACLVREEAVQIGKWMDSITGKLNEPHERRVAAGSTMRRIICGDRKSGKSVLLLQAIANALLRGWVVISLPEGRDLVNAQSEYRPISGTTPVQYTLPTYTANLLTQIIIANRSTLAQLETRLQHNIPGARISKPISLDKLAGLGAADPNVSWTVFLALWRELMEPSSSNPSGSQQIIAGANPPILHPQARPPVLLVADNITHLLVPTEYKTVDASGKLQPIHPFDFTLIQHFMTHLAGQVTFTNGGIVLAATCESDGRRSDPLNVARSMWKDRQTGQTRGPLAREVTLPGDASEAEIKSILIDNDIGGLASAAIPTIGSSMTPLGNRKTISAADQDLNDYWLPYKKLDMRVMEMLRGVEFMELGGMSKDEARRLIEYWAESGMVRRKIDESWVAEKWTLAGGGIVGELEKSVVRSGF